MLVRHTDTNSYIIFKLSASIRGGGGADAVVIKLPACKVGDRGYEPHSGRQISRKQNVTSPLTRKDSTDR